MINHVVYWVALGYLKFIRCKFQPLDWTKERLMGGLNSPRLLNPRFTMLLYSHSLLGSCCLYYFNSYCFTNAKYFYCKVRVHPSSSPAFSYPAAVQECKNTHHESKFFPYFLIHLWSCIAPLALCSWTKPIIQDILPLV